MRRCPAARRGSCSGVPLLIVLMTYNLNYANPDFATTLDAIEAADADVVLLQEVSDAWRTALRARFEQRYPHAAFHVHTRAAGGLAVLSKLPIERDELWAPPAGTGAWFPAERLVVTTAFGPVQLLNVHLRPALDRGSWIRGFMTTPDVPRAEIAAHWTRVDRALPTIVAGDFNEDPTGRAVDFLAGQGLARVATAGPPSWRYEVTSRAKTFDLLKMDIDHVMIDGQLAARDARVLAAGTSDHRPVVVAIGKRS